MKSVKRVTALLLVSVMISMLAAGCASTPSGTTQPTTTKQETTAATSKATETQAETTEALYTFKVFVNIWPAEMSEVSRLFFERWEKENNIKIEWEMPPTANYAERLQIMMAGGDYPDVVNFMDHNDPIFRNAVADDVIIPITEYVAKAANLQQYTYPVSWDAVKAKEGSDDIYMIPRTSIARNDGYIVRKDWLANVGLEMPADNAVTLDEFKEILKRFTKNDPDQNGKNDTYGYTDGPLANGGLWVFVTGAFDLMGWQKYSNEEYAYMDLMYSRVSDNYKRALSYTADLWKEGLIDPDWPLNKGSAHMDKIYRGEAGMTRVFAGHVQPRQEDTQKNNPNAQMTYLVGIKDAQGKVKGTSSILGIWGGFALTQTAEKPERIVMAFDWLLSDGVWDEVKYGPEGLTYKVVDGEKVPTDAYTQARWSSIFLRRNNDPSFFISLTVPKDQKETLSNWLEQSLNTFVFSADKGYQPPVAKDPKFIDAKDKLAQVVTKIIVGDMAVDTYDAALAEWYANGGEDYVKQMNEFLAK